MNTVLANDLYIADYWLFYANNQFPMIPQLNSRRYSIEFYISFSTNLDQYINLSIFRSITPVPSLRLLLESNWSCILPSYHLCFRWSADFSNWHFTCYNTNSIWRSCMLEAAPVTLMPCHQFLWILSLAQIICLTHRYLLQHLTIY